MANFIDTPHGNTIAYNQFIGKKTGIVFLSGFKSDMKGNKALYLENWAKNNDHSFLRFDYSGHGESSGKIDKKCFSDWYMDAEFLIKKLTKGKQILIGSSMGGWVMLMLAKNLKKNIFGLIGLAAAPDFPKLLIWDKMNINQKKSLIKNRKITISNNDGSQHIFSYKFIKDSFKNLVLYEDLHFDGPVYLYHGMADTDVPYTLSIDIMKKIVGTQNVKLLLDKEAGHRLSEANQLKIIIDMIEKMRT